MGLRIVDCGLRIADCGLRILEGMEHGAGSQNPVFRFQCSGQREVSGVSVQVSGREAQMLKPRTCWGAAEIPSEAKRKRGHPTPETLRSGAWDLGLGKA